VPIGKNLDTVKSKQGDLVTARENLATASQQLATAEKALATGQKLLTTNRASIVAGIKQLEGVISGPHPPGPWPPASAVAQLKQLQAALVGIDTALAGLPTAKGQLAQGKAQIATGKAQIATGASALADAKKKLQKAKAVMAEVAKGNDVLINLAKYRVTQLALVSPVDGIVTEARTAGTVAMVNAPIVRIRPDGPTDIETYLTGDQLETVSLGSSATVDFDSNTAGPLPGKVTFVATNAQFPPTGFPTNIVHMTQTVRVRITLDKGGWAPPGTPVDVRIKTNSGR
jgi:multidrug resistance efflux pump